MVAIIPGTVPRGRTPIPGNVPTHSAFCKLLMPSYLAAERWISTTSKPFGRWHNIRFPHWLSHTSKPTFLRCGNLIYLLIILLAPTYSWCWTINSHFNESHHSVSERRNGADSFVSPVKWKVLLVTVHGFLKRFMSIFFGTKGHMWEISPTPVTCHPFQHLMSPSYLGWCWFWGITWARRRQGLGEGLRV